MASIGALAIAPSNPQIIYVGTGEETRGDGVYKSTDGGKSWTNVGLRETHYIGSIVDQRDQSGRGRRRRNRRPDTEPGARRLPHDRWREDMDEGALRRRHGWLSVGRRGARCTAGHVRHAVSGDRVARRVARAADRAGPASAEPRRPPFKRDAAVFNPPTAALRGRNSRQGLASPPVGRQALGVVAKSGGRIVLAGLQDGLYRSEDGGETLDAREP